MAGVVLSGVPEAGELGDEYEMFRSFRVWSGNDQVLITRPGTVDHGGWL
jgi:hypothetical protein